MNLCIGFIGNVDQGKTSFIDFLFSTKYIKLEPGQITQTLRVKELKANYIKNILKNYNIAQNIDFPNLILIDTPGHGYFKSIHNLIYKITDIIFIFQDVRQITDRTIEIIKNLQQNNCTFIILLTKIDLIPGWNKKSEKMIENIKLQNPEVQNKFNDFINKFINRLYQESIFTDLFFKSKDLIPIFPISTFTNEGISEILLYICLKLQKNKITQNKCFLLDQINKTNFVFLCLEKIKINETYFLNEEKVYIDKILDLNEIEYKETDYKKIYILKLKNAETHILGSILHSNAIIVKSKPYGFILKADSLGKLGALELLLEKLDLPILQSSILPIYTRDILLYNSNNNEENKFIICLSDIKPKIENIKLIHSSIIYNLEQTLFKHIKIITDIKKNNILKKIIFPCRFKILEKYIFKKTNPYIIGCEIEFGTLKIGYDITYDKVHIIGNVTNIELNNKKINEATENMQISIEINCKLTLTELLKCTHLDVYILNHIEDLKKLNNELTLKQNKYIEEYDMLNFNNK